MSKRLTNAQLQLPIFGTLGNGTTIKHPETGRYVLPCDLMPPNDVALTLTLGGMDFGLQYRDIVYVACPRSQSPHAPRHEY